MKKILLTILIIFITPLSSYAVDVMFEGRANIALNETKNMLNLSISQTDAGEIKSQYGINLILNSDVRALWDDAENITLEGTAVTNGKIASSIMPVFSNDYKSLNIPVINDFSTGENIVIYNLRIRAYDRYVSPNTVGIDLNGDMTSEIYVDNAYQVLDTMERTDVTPPYPVTNLQYTYNENTDSLHLTWVQPPDYDVMGVKIDKTLVRDGFTTESMLTSDAGEEYIDTDIKPNDSITYRVYAIDRRNEGEKTELVIQIGQEGGIVIPGQSEQPAENPVQQPTDEMTQLSNLFNYYKGRYSIKCMPSGVPALPSDSACLWARVDIVYAQEMLDRSEVDTAITDYDKELMSKRMKYPEARYQTNCVEAETPADYCSALGKALDRIQYFIEQ